jgi:hypothetical protein
MDRRHLDRIGQDARGRRVRELGRFFERVLQALGRLLMHQPAAPPQPDPSVERFMGLANFQERLKNSRPPRIAVIRSISRSKCSGTSTKFRRSLFTISSGLSE